MSSASTMISSHSRQIRTNMRSQQLISAALLSTTSSIGKNRVAATFKPWPKPVIESDGDYTKEAFIEERIGGPLYGSQKELPHLPIPSIQETISLFLPSALPLAESKEEIESLLKDCKSFPKEASQLQKKLESRKESCLEKNTSWLQLWWNQIGYLQFREPTVVNVSYFFQLDDDKSLQPSTTEALYKNSHFDLGIKRGAASLIAMARYRQLVCSGSLPVERIGKNQTPLCSVAFKYMFHSCRIPHRTSDTFRIYDPSQFKHCIVACKGQFYAMDFVDRNQDPLPLSVLEKGLERCVEMAKSASRDGTSLPELGIFTSGNRDSWADTRDQLLQIGGDKMSSAMDLLESGAFVLCLDDSAPITKKECANIYWHGNKASGANRWFDKSIQLLCQSNGKLGYVGEHSMADGMPAVALCDLIKQLEYQSLKKECQRNEDVSSLSLPFIQNIFEDAISTINGDDINVVESSLNKAKYEYERLVDNQELDVLSFQAFGSNYIKKSSYSPDGLVQTALQLASYRLMGKQVATYESSQVRLFLHGRTETTRSVSQANEAFVKAMGMYPKQNETNVDIRKEKLELLRNATEYHSKYLKHAARGYGVDRHFFGLSMLTGDNLKTPSLFSNPLFIRSKQWRLSTSTLPNTPGFGPVVEDGIGIGYEIKPDCCYFTITSRKKNDYVEAMRHLIEESLLEIQLLIDLDKQPPISKL